MFNAKKTTVNTAVTNTVIGDSIKIENAILTGEGTVRIDGEFVGNIDIDGDVILGESGSLIGDLVINNALIAGQLKGNVKSRVTIHLASTANISGNLDTQKLIIDEGAVFNGESHMGKEPISLELHRTEETG